MCIELGRNGDKYTAGYETRVICDRSIIRRSLGYHLEADIRTILQLTSLCDDKDATEISLYSALGVELKFNGFFTTHLHLLVGDIDFYLVVGVYNFHNSM